ncbi:hypothetical protein DCAR_0415676 [Daucus carota subsp. sativus]|uniref:Uncharacterized protein n=1 Tax=Daucus carota subsp. sativus TaxID=79200 RepID=A0A165WMJ3_DAUCS|nr:hypothetical protein DCAR_0415676 [Daucus carota subsp. sativus]
MEPFKETPMMMLQQSDQETMAKNQATRMEEGDIIDMVQNLKIDEPCMEETSKQEINTKISTKDVDDIEMMEIEDDGSINVNMQEEEVVEDNFNLTPDHNSYIGLEDEMKIWESTEYTCTHPI